MQKGNRKEIALNKNVIGAKFLLLPFYFLLFTFLSFAQTLAPGAPGNDAQWATAGKQAIGTSASLESKIWFTLAQGVLTEVYYPDVTIANVHVMQFVVVDPKTKKVETERDDALHQIKALRSDSLSFQQINTAKNGAWKITKTYTTDTERASVLIDVKFESKNKNLNLYVYYDPSLGNTGMHDRAYSPLLQLVGNYEYEKGTITKDGIKSVKKTGSATVSGGMGSEEGKYASAVFFSSDIEEYTNNYLGKNDGLEQLRKFGKITETYAEASNGNVVQMARIMKPQQFTTIISFGEDILKASTAAAKSHEKGFAKCLAEYEKGWSGYVKTVRKVEPKYQAQFNMAAMVLKAYEDKTVRGANVASLSIPWGGGLTANEDVGGGYHLVWSRDLYQVFTAYLALGDTAAAERALDFLFKIQQKEDGSFPQNSWLDGRNGWGGLQMDEVGYPLIMAYQLKRFDKETYEDHVKKAADFIVKNGPVTPQERWEEKGGYSPSTIAAEIAGLVCAAEIAKKNGDTASANLWLKTADDWQANVEKWTATTNGKYGDGNYYVRLTANGKPDAGERIELNNNAGSFYENEIVDAGFLELVRLGIKSPDDPLIVKSLKVVDDVIRVKTPHGDSFYRYNNDGYGEMDDGRRWNWDGKYTGKGRLWALLSGERGQYELAKYAEQKVADEKLKENGLNRKVDVGIRKDITYFSLIKAKSRLDSMLGFANEGLMIAEQVWDKPATPKNIDRQFVPELKFGEGTGSATPLAWSMAQFIRLAVNLQSGKNLDTPDVVYNRYVLEKKDGNAELTQTQGEIQSSVNIDSIKDLPLQKRPSLSLFPKQQNVNNPDKTEALKIIDPSCEESYKLSKNSSAGFFPPQQWKPASIPLVSTHSASFFYLGEAKEIAIAGDFTDWKPQKLAMKNVLETDWKCFQMNFAPTARVEYKLIVDGKWINDPLNPNKIDNGVGGENSFFEMPDYKPTEWDKDNHVTIDGAEPSNYFIMNPKTERLNVQSKIYGEKVIQVYNPKSEQPLPVVYFQDGSDYINRAKAVQIQFNLVKANKIKPFIMVFLDPKDRNKEYWASDDYAKFVAAEVVPAIDAKYKTVKTRDGRAIIGASLGGITSIHAALKYPEIFGRVGAQSASFWVDNERVVKELEMLDGNAKFKFYIDDGTLEGVDDSHKVVEMLKKKGFDVTYNESEAGHNWTAWRDRLADAFTEIWK